MINVVLLLITITNINTFCYTFGETLTPQKAICAVILRLALI
jgi:hypothetical protein